MKLTIDQETKILTLRPETSREDELVDNFMKLPNARAEVASVNHSDALSILQIRFVSHKALEAKK